LEVWRRLCVLLESTLTARKTAIVALELCAGAAGRTEDDEI